MARKTDHTYICMKCLAQNPDPMGEGYCWSCGAECDDEFDDDEDDDYE